MSCLAQANITRNLNNEIMNNFHSKWHGKEKVNMQKHTDPNYTAKNTSTTWKTTQLAMNDTAKKTWMR